tara:strand:+ start:1467 stop:2018 length:552 start_codon:yes stop_codon:yes gene_type:complete
VALFRKGGDKKLFSSKASLAFYEVDEYRKKLKKQIKEEESEIMYACDICGKKAGSPWAKCSKCGGDVSRMEQASDVTDIMDKREQDGDNFGKEATFGTPTPVPKPQKREGKKGLITGLNHEGEEDELDLEDVSIRMIESEDLMDFKELMKKPKKKIVKKSSKKVPSPKKKVNVKKRAKGSVKK